MQFNVPRRAQYLLSMYVCTCMYRVCAGMYVISLQSTKVSYKLLCNQRLKPTPFFCVGFDCWPRGIGPCCLAVVDTVGRQKGVKNIFADMIGVD